MGWKVDKQIFPSADSAARWPVTVNGYSVTDLVVLTQVDESTGKAHEIVLDPEQIEVIYDLLKECGAI